MYACVVSSDAASGGMPPASSSFVFVIAYTIRCLSAFASEFDPTNSSVFGKNEPFGGVCDGDTWYGWPNALAVTAYRSTGGGGAWKSPAFARWVFDIA